MSCSIIYLGLDVHKESVTIAVLPAAATTPTRVEKLPCDLPKLHRFFRRLASEGVELRACYEASGAGYVLHRAMRDWGYHCDVIAPSLIPTKPGVHRKYDKYDAVQLARLYRAGELTAVRIPSEAEERVRDLVRCRETFQREILKSRHYLLKFLARRGLVYREGTNWSRPHWDWLRRLAGAKTLADEDAIVFGEYLALLEYKIGRREDLDRRIEALALTPSLAPMVARLQCFRGIQVHIAMVLATELVDWRRFEDPRQLMAYVGLVPSESSSGDRRRLGAIYESGEPPVSACPRPSGVELSVSPESESAAHDAPTGATGERRRPRVERATSIAQAVRAPGRAETAADSRGGGGAGAGRVSLECDADARRGARRGGGLRCAVEACGWGPWHECGACSPALCGAPPDHSRRWNPRV
jgi:transposase